MGTKIKYWRTQEEQEAQTPINHSNIVSNEFVEPLPLDVFADTKNEDVTSRRDFLKYLGFSITAASLASCEAPVIKSIPYVHKPEEITPGVANWYATTYFDAKDYASILVKTREGRPIHIQPNTKFGFNQGAINARINASVLSLYDSERLQQPVLEGKPSTWAEIDAKVIQSLKQQQQKGKKIVLVTSSIASPSTNAVIEEFTKTYNAKHIAYDPLNLSAIAKANELCFDTKGMPLYDFSKAKVVVSFSADFLNDFILSTRYTAQYAQAKNPEKAWMSKHFHFESCLSLTGSNADYRAPLTPMEEFLAIVALHNEIAARLGKTHFIPMNTKATLANPVLTKAIDALIKNAKEGIVICGHNHVGLQIVVNKINSMLGNIGVTVLPQTPVRLASAQDNEMLALVRDMQAGEVGALILWDVNPAYNFPQAELFKNALKKVPFSVALSLYQDETASLTTATAPTLHYLESWNDAEIIQGELALTQPVIQPLYNTRAGASSLLRWAGKTVEFNHEFIQKIWEKDFFTKQSDYTDFTSFWNYSLHNGVAKLNLSSTTPSFKEEALDQIDDIYALTSQNVGEYQLILYTKVGIGDGRHANNPWLQELPDPITKVAWDNYITMNPEDMKAFDFPTYYDQETPLQMATLSIEGYSITLPVFPAYGQKRKTLGVALGYGRGMNGEKIGRAAFQTKEYGGYEMHDDKRVPIGQNAYPFLTLQKGNFLRVNPKVLLQATEKKYKIACTQIHHTIMDRDSVLKEVDFSTYKNTDKTKYNPENTLQAWDNQAGKYVEKNVAAADLWEAHPIENAGHRWGMTIDLSTCIGCGACATACQSENNVPVVGKDEIRRVRDMFWLRIDRYFSSDYTKEKAKEEGKSGVLGSIEQYAQMEKPSSEENLRVVFQPVMCQHCTHAPCETVCPVSATTHSNEGLNQMTYNRCNVIAPTTVHTKYVVLTGLIILAIKNSPK